MVNDTSNNLLISLFQGLKKKKKVVFKNLKYNKIIIKNIYIYKLINQLQEKGGKNQLKIILQVCFSKKQLIY